MADVTVVSTAPSILESFPSRNEHRAIVHGTTYIGDGYTLQASDLGLKSIESISILPTVNAIVSGSLSAIGADNNYLTLSLKVYDGGSSTYVAYAGTAQAYYIAIGRRY